MAKTGKIHVMCDACGLDFWMTEAEYNNDGFECPICECTDIVDWEPDEEHFYEPSGYFDDGPSDADPGL